MAMANDQKSVTIHFFDADALLQIIRSMPQWYHRSE